MIIKPIDEQKDLFEVSQVITTSLICDFNKEDIDCYEWRPQEWQEQLPRRKLIAHNGSALQAIIEEVVLLPKKINSVLGTNFVDISFACWYDLEGFDQQVHVDNSHVKSVLHFYIGEADKDHGTTWYSVGDNDVEERDDAQKWYLQNVDLPVRHTFDFVANTGYIQFNNRLQAHGPTTTVKAKQKRVSFYCYLL
jgi:hypothetical protein